MPRTPPPRPPLVDETTYRIFQHALYGRLHAQTTINTFYSRVLLTDYNAIATAAFADGFWQAIRPQLLAALSQEMGFTGIITRVMGHPEIIPTVTTFGVLQQGTVVSESLPTTNAVILTHFSAWGGKRGRGRKYMPGVSETHSANSVLTAAGTTLFDALAARFKVDWGATGFAVVQLPFLYSRNRGTEAGVAGTLVTDVKTVPTIATQRRRKLGRGI